MCYFRQYAHIAPTCYKHVGEDPPECVSCNEPFTVKHFMTECSDLRPTRDKYYNVHDMKELFDTTHITSILDFLKEVNLYFKL